ncbi:hypothetical protein [Marinilabilia salmonicolor]|uniref:hypothetical protein n=1 Tax=Marinilabilia salmonicolor TaxID=989 RepID=UPI00029B2726|nr:hypothetical protein [Marinilabilia salmonicolor]
MQLKNICILTFLLFSIGTNAQLFGPKRSNLNMELSDWKIFQGDTVTLTWNVTINRKQLKVITIDGQGNFVKGLADDKQIKEDNPFHTVIEKYEDKTYPVRNFSVKEYELGETEYRPQQLMMVLDY